MEDEVKLLTDIPKKHQEIEGLGLCFVSFLLWRSGVHPETCGFLGEFITTPVVQAFGIASACIPLSLSVAGAMLVTGFHGARRAWGAVALYLTLGSMTLRSGFVGHVLRSGADGFLREMSFPILLFALFLGTLALFKVSPKRVVGSAVKAASGPLTIDVPFSVSPPVLSQPPALSDPNEGNELLPELSVFNPSKSVALASDDGQGPIIEQKFLELDRVVKFVGMKVGPRITCYEIVPSVGTKNAQLLALQDDMARLLKADAVRIAPIKGTDRIGVEVQSKVVVAVGIREILAGTPIKKMALPVALGMDVSGKPISMDLQKAPHVLTAGSTGSGKSVFLNAMICSLLYSKTPEELRFVFVDPKQVELTGYDGIPHLLRPVITEASEALAALNDQAVEMDRRGKLFRSKGVRDIGEFNALKGEAKMPYIVIIIDEAPDLLVTSDDRKELEKHIQRLGAKARSSGIHLVIAAQRPSVEVISGTLKNNLPCRISFALSSQIDSRTILDSPGAETLLGRGDMIYKPMESPNGQRIQGCLVSKEEIDRIVDFWKNKAGDYQAGEPLSEDPSPSSREVDPQVRDAAIAIVESGVASTSNLRSRFGIGHARATNIMRELESLGIIGPHAGSRVRAILATKETLESLLSGEEPLSEPLPPATLPGFSLMEEAFA